MIIQPYPTTCVALPSLWAEILCIFAPKVLAAMECRSMEFYFSTSRDEDRILAFGPASKRKNSVFEGYAGVVW